MSLSPTPARPARFSALKRAPTVFVQFTGEEQGKAVLGKLVDFSSGGAKVLLDTPLPFEQEVTLRLESDELQLHLLLAARVCWIRPSGALWRLGFSFEPPLEEEAIQRLLSQGVMERRRDPRFPIDRSATALWELNPQPTPVTIVDLSGGGFCLRAPLPAEPHSRLRLQVDGSELLEVTATVQWRLATGETYLLGCSLPNLDSSALLREALQPRSPIRTRSPRRKLLWCALAAAAAGVAAALLR